MFYKWFLNCLAFLNFELLAFSYLSAQHGQRVPMDTKIFSGITGLVYVNVWVAPDMILSLNPGERLN